MFRDGALENLENWEHSDEVLEEITTIFRKVKIYGPREYVKDLLFISVKETKTKNIAKFVVFSSNGKEIAYNFLVNNKGKLIGLADV